MATVIQDVLNVCRVCLALDVKMYHLKDLKLSEMFQNITGISAIENKSGILQRVCWECVARLKAAAAFREKALLSDALLKDQVNIKESDITSIKTKYSYLKSPLSVITAFSLYDIESEQIVSENQIDNIFIPNNTAAKDIKTKPSNNETDRESEDHEPLIDFPVKTEVESDPIAFHDRKGVKCIQYINDTSPRVDREGVMTNTEPQINNNERIKDIGGYENKVPVFSDVNIVFVEENDEIEKKPKLDCFGNIVCETSSGQDRHFEGVSCNKYIQNVSKVGNKKERANIRINEHLKEKIIALKKKGLSVPAISQETGASVWSIRGWLYRNNLNVTYKKSSTSRLHQTEIESDSEQNDHYEAGKELAACSATVRRRMRQAGLEHILMKKPGMSVNSAQNISKNKALHDYLKQRIVALKQEGISISKIAYLLDTTRITVRKWWDRWCNEGHMNNYKSTGSKRKTTPQEDQLLIQRVAQEQTVHTPTLAKELGISTKSVRSRLREAGFKLQERKASVPQRSGRSHKVDDVTKQQIISMKHNGVSVTEIANQFRVTRTSVYLWWRRWCKENNIDITKDNNTSATTEQDQSLTENATVEKIVHTPSILSSKKSLWQISPDMAFTSLSKLNE